MEISNRTSFLFLALGLVFAAMITFSSCRKERIFTDSSAKLEFSTDTVVFDTVFSTIGSTYRRFTVRNPYNKKIIISNVRLQGGTSSAYRINVDGLPGVDIKDVEILANDSIFIFVEVTIDPNGSLNPFVVEDKVLFTTNGNEQFVQLAAWGQNAYFHYEADGLLIICNETWMNDKPHVLYGITAIDSACSLDILAGTKIYGHNNALLYNYKGTLNISGTEGDEVLFQGDRLESFYQDVPGQWFGVRMFQPLESTIEHAIIKNGEVGIWIDTVEGGQKVNLNYVSSGNHGFASLLAQGTKIVAENCLFYDGGSHSALLNVGGDYNFNHCTFSNYWTTSTRTTTALKLNNFFVANNTIFHRPIVQATFNNCIVYGDKDNEILIDTLETTTPNYIFNRCVIKTDQSTNNGHYPAIRKNQDPRFVEPSSFDYHLGAGSSAIDYGDFPAPTNGNDLDGVMRIVPNDVGCYEAQ